MDASIVDLRYKMKDVLRAIDRGETVTVLYRGKARAKLTPVTTQADTAEGRQPKTEDQPLFGLWSDREDMQDPEAYVRSLRQPRTALKRARSIRKSTKGGKKPR